MAKDSEVACHKCKSTKGLTLFSFHRNRYICSKCSSIPNYKHRKGAFTYDGTLEWQEMARVSRERILARPQ